MLNLTRRVGEKLMIGDEVVVTVIAAQDNQVRLGVEAPKKTAVHREEVYRRTQESEAQTKRPGNH